MGGKCCVVYSDECEAPANGPGLVRTRCFACGQYVCRPCSLMRDWHRWTRKRVCMGCHEDEERRQARVRGGVGRRDAGAAHAGVGLGPARRTQSGAR